MKNYIWHQSPEFFGWADNPEPVNSLSNINLDTNKDIFKSNFTDSGPFNRKEQNQIGFNVQSNHSR